MLKKQLLVFFAVLLLWTGLAVAADNGVFMVFDIVDFRDTQNYRTSDMIAKSLDKKQNGMSSDNCVSTEGLIDLHISGSAPLDRSGVERIVRDTAGYKLFVIDLRQEAHAYLNSTPITWYAKDDWINKGLSDKQAAAADAERISWLARQDMADVYLDKKRSRLLHVAVVSATDEETFIRSFNVAYKRFFVTDHMAPSIETVDAFVKYCDELPQNAWLHFHCRGGHGRTTTFMVLYDIMKNAGNVSLADIVSRQAELPPNYNVLTSDDFEAGKNRQELFEKRSAAIKLFYEYAKNRKITGSKTGWLEYLKANQTK